MLFPLSFPFQTSLPTHMQTENVEAWTELPASVRAEVGSPFCFLCENPWLLVVKALTQSFCCILHIDTADLRGSR